MPGVTWSKSNAKMSVKKIMIRQIKSRELKFSVNLCKLLIPSYPYQAMSSLSSPPQLYRSWVSTKCLGTLSVRSGCLELIQHIHHQSSKFLCSSLKWLVRFHFHKLHSLGFYRVKNISQSKDVQGENHSHINTTAENWPCMHSVTQQLPVHSHPK